MTGDAADGCLSVAIVGAGPAGFYAADALLRKPNACRIDIIDRLPTPFGLVRSGVAPDHQTTKNVVRVYDRILQRPEVRFLGNIELGKDLTYQDLKRLYDVVILAVGAQAPRQLGLLGESLEGVLHSTSVVNWYNAVPGSLDLSGEIDATCAVVIGNGNVALDIARLLAKTPEELKAGDIDPAAAEAIARAPLTDIYVVGRRGPLQASFTSPELTELGELAEAVPLVDAADLPDDVSGVPEDQRPKKEKNLRILKEFAAIDRDADPRPVRIHMLFRATPVDLIGDDRLRAVRFERNRLEDGRAVGTGETFEIEAQLFITAIGYRVAGGENGPPIDEARGTVRNVDGRVEPGVYAVGWARRGPTGVIGTNRNDAREVVDAIAKEIPKGHKPGPEGLDALLSGRGVEVVTYEDWRRIDEAETAAAEGDPERPRVKFRTVSEMLKAAHGED